MAVADFNGDGNPDVAFVDTKNGGIGLLVGNGKGQFSEMTAFTGSFGSAGNPIYMLAADLNGDGKPDLVTVSGDAGSGEVGVLINNGDGTFGAYHSIYQAGGNNYLSIMAATAAVADVNRDGHPDIFVINVDSGLLLEFLGNGDGTFQAPRTIPTSSIPSSVALADMRHSGIMDLILGFGSSVAVMPGKGDGTFGAAVPYPVAAASAFVAVGDLDGDGNPDVAVAGISATGGVITVFLNTGNGQLSAGTSYSVTENPTSLVLADVNHDGSLDLISAGRSTGNSAGGAVSVLTNNGKGQFSPETLYYSGDSPVAAAVADVNGDGVPDLLVNSAGLIVAYGMGDGRFATAITMSVSGLPPGALLTDVNGDGKLDALYVVNGPSPQLYVMLGNGDGTFQPAQVSSAGGLYLNNHLVAGNLYSDGHLDLAAVNRDGAVVVMRGNGDGTFQHAIDLPNTQGYFDIALVDLRGRGIDDIVVSEANSASIAVLLNNGNGTFAAPQNYNVVGSTNDFSYLAIADFNGDQHPDVVALNNNTVNVLLGNGDGTLTTGNTYVIGSAGQLGTAVATGDLRGDGKIDIVATADAGNVSDGTINILLGNGDGTFQAVKLYDGGIQPENPVVADLDGDGKMDVIVSNSDASTSTLNVYHGNGDGTIGSVQQYAVGLAPSAIAIGDLANDGRPDVMVADYTSSDITFLFPLTLQIDATVTPDSTLTGSISQSFPTLGATSYTVVRSPAHGTVALTGSVANGYSYTPAAGYSGLDSFLIRNSVTNGPSFIQVNIDVTASGSGSDNGSGSGGGSGGSSGGGSGYGSGGGGIGFLALLTLIAGFASRRAGKKGLRFHELN